MQAGEVGGGHPILAADVDLHHLARGERVVGACERASEPASEQAIYAITFSHASIGKWLRRNIEPKPRKNGSISCDLFGQ